MFADGYSRLVHGFGAACAQLHTWTHPAKIVADSDFNSIPDSLDHLLPTADEHEKKPKNDHLKVFWHNFLRATPQEQSRAVQRDPERHVKRDKSKVSRMRGNVLAWLKARKLNKKKLNEENPAAESAREEPSQSKPGRDRGFEGVWGRYLVRSQKKNSAASADDEKRNELVDLYLQTAIPDLDETGNTDMPEFPDSTVIATSELAENGDTILNIGECTDSEATLTYHNTRSLADLQMAPEIQADPFTAQWRRYQWVFTEEDGGEHHATMKKIRGYMHEYKNFVASKEMGAYMPGNEIDNQNTNAGDVQHIGLGKQS